MLWRVVGQSVDLRAGVATGGDAALVPSGHDHSQFWVPVGGQAALCVGIHSQLV